jgi:DnaJ-class molecular chaperone
MKNYYQLFGIEETASQEEIKRAFRRMASLYHPDHNPQSPKEAEERFKEINQAYEVLSDEVRRRQYDRLIYQPGPRRLDFSMEEFLNWSFSGGDFLGALLRELVSRRIIFNENPRSKPWGCSRGRGQRCRRYYSQDE